MVFLLVVPFSFDHSDEPLRFARFADRHHQSPANFQLRHERLRHSWTTGGNQYGIVGSIRGPSQSSVKTLNGRVVNIQLSSITDLINTFSPPRFYLSEESIREAIKHKSMFNLIDTTEGDKIDFWILTNDAFDKSRFKRKIEEDIFGFSMKVSSPEDTILAKLKWIKLSGGSQKQFTDALRVYEVQYHTLIQPI